MFHTLTTQQTKLQFSILYITCLLENKQKGENSELNDRKHSPNLICSSFSREFNLVMLVPFHNILSLPHPQRICLLSALHSGADTW
jgi:hypothetical protein